MAEHRGDTLHRQLIKYFSTRNRITEELCSAMNERNRVRALIQHADPARYEGHAPNTLALNQLQMGFDRASAMVLEKMSALKRLNDQNPSMSSSFVEYASIVQSEKRALEEAQIADLIQPGATFSHAVL